MHSSQPPSHTPPAAFRFDAARWTRADRITGGATLVLVVSLFLPWFTASAGFGSFTASASTDGLSAHGYLYLVLILALATLAYLVARAGLRDVPTTPVSHERLLAVVAAVDLLLVLIAALIKPGGDSLVRVSWSFGAFVALVAAIVALIPVAGPALRGRGAEQPSSVQPADPARG